jgi:hypothetical protein
LISTYCEVGGAVGERHVLQLALATGIADRAVERVIAEQQFNGGLAGLRDLGRFGVHHHAFGDGGGAGGLQLGDLLDAHDAHAAGGLQGESGIVAERGNLDARGAAGFNEQSARGRGHLLAVDSQIYVSHELSFRVPLRAHQLD